MAEHGGRASTPARSTIEHPPTRGWRRRSTTTGPPTPSCSTSAWSPPADRRRVVRSLLAVCEKYKDGVGPGGHPAHRGLAEHVGDLVTAGTHGGRAAPAPGSLDRRPRSADAAPRGPASDGARPRGRHYRRRDAEGQTETRRPRGRGLGRDGRSSRIAVAVTVVLVGGSLIAIHTQSAGYRTSTTAGYAALADRVGRPPTRPASELSPSMAGGPDPDQQAVPDTARGVLRAGARRAGDRHRGAGDPGAELRPRHPRATSGPASPG